MKTYFEREDWTLFRALPTLVQKAGVAAKWIPRLVVKELVDNALDADGSCRYGELPRGGFFVEDGGPGLHGSDEEIASLFSIRRPLTSSKLLRLPTRGAVGNGLRVVVGAVLASAGTLTVSTCGRKLRLTPRDDGVTKARVVGKGEEVGTRVEVRLGRSLDDGDDNIFAWAARATVLANGEKHYGGRSSPWWYDSDSFHELLQAAKGRTVRQVLAELEGCSGKKAGLVSGGLASRPAVTLLRKQSEQLLRNARKASRPVKPQRLGYVGGDVLGAYVRGTGTFAVKSGRGNLDAEIPFVVETWAAKDDESCIKMHVNRTPITAGIGIERCDDEKTCLLLYGCELEHKFRVGRRYSFSFYVNIITPFLPITSDGKRPDFEPVADELLAVLGRGARKARKEGGGPSGPVKTKKAFILQTLPGAIEKVRGEHKLPFSVRRLYYAVRPSFGEAFGEELNYETFSQVITDHEAELGHDLDGIYRDPRGTLYHPHTGEEIPLGTINVERYERPPWTFNKILYCEKEGVFPLLREAKWPERRDCALLTSKGYASRAARDVLDLRGKTGEDITFFCIHDADGDGTAIYEKLQEATRARPGRQVHIINLGLEPEEALEMGLPVEKTERGKRKARVAAYVTPEWQDWFQKNRVELDAMTSPEFLEWLDRKMDAHDRGKVVPPREVLRERLDRDVREQLESDIKAEILRKARIESRVDEAFRKLEPSLRIPYRGIESRVQSALDDFPESRWSDVVKGLAAAVVEGREKR